MRKSGEIVLFDEEDLREGSHEAIQAIKGIQFGDVKMPYGFTLIEEDGRKYVVPMAQEDWLGLMTRVNPEFDHHGEASRSCYQTGPASCNPYYCGDGYSCTRQYDPATNSYWCGCA